jgi:hypothetical protein
MFEPRLGVGCKYTAFMTYGRIVSYVLGGRNQLPSGGRIGNVLGL